MADWASKANYNNPLFTIYHTLQFAKHKGMWEGGGKFTDYYGHECENTFGYASRAPPSRTGARTVKVFCHPVSYCEVLPARFVTPACFVAAYRKIHSAHGLSLFSSNIVRHLSSSLDVCIGVRECTRALGCVVLLSPLQIRIKMNLFCIWGRLQGHRCQRCQI